MKSRESGQSSVPAGSLKQPLPARDGTFFGIRISITTTYLRRGKRAFFPVFSRENRRIRGDIIPAGCYRNLFATCRLKSGIPMSGERPRRSGSDAPARFGSGCGFRPEGEGEAVIRAQTGAWFFLEIGGFLQKNGNYRSKQGCTTRNGRTYAAWRTIECITMESNASSAIRVLFPGPGRTGPDRGSDNPIPNTLCPENKKPYVSLIHKDFASCLLFFQRFSERKTGLGPATSTLARLRSTN